jgi:hypothetical protein
MVIYAKRKANYTKKSIEIMESGKEEAHVTVIDHLNKHGIV